MKAAQRFSVSEDFTCLQVQEQPQVVLPGHKISLTGLLVMSFSCARCSELSGRLCLIRWELNKTVLSDAFLGS